MRSVPAGSFQRLSDPEALWAVWLQCRRGKRRQPRMAAFDLDADSAILQLHHALRNGSYHPSPYQLKVVRDPKTRLVAAPAITDRIVQIALLNEIGPTYERGFIDQSYACCSGRGPHRAVLAYLQATRRYCYRLLLDIRRYFASINHAILCRLFARRLRDEQTIALLRQLITTGGEVYRTPLAREILGLAHDPLPAGCGLPLGAYLSHWSGGLYLDGLDHFGKRVLKIKAYQRYMDDITLFHNDRIVLAEACSAIRAWLKAERGLELKSSDNVIRPTSEPSTYLGFRVSRAGVAPGPKAKRRLRQRLRRAHAIGSSRLARSLQAYRGMMLSI